ncbi:MAG: hypothetical protein HC803_02125 [Saprospiraceae bacterium]|nr:hypothetical protein [Saprospiraceae bacterium]
MMLRIIQKLPLFYLVLLAIVGVIMRLMPFVDLPFNFENIRHAHSHLAFLGWVYTAFYVLIWRFFLSDSKHEKRLSFLFWITQLAIIGMFVCFWNFGYQPISIGFMVVHTFLAYWFIAYVLRHIEVASITRFLLLAAFGFFIFSSIGPFSIPILKVMEQEEYMTAAVNFYLHFHYNGWFIFGIFALLSHFMDFKAYKTHFWILIGTTIFAYFELLYLYQLPPFLLLLTNIFIILQWIIVSILIFEILKQFKTTFINSTKTVVTIAFSILWIKYSTQVLGVLPSSWLEFEFFTHFNIIAYLHLLFLGFVTPMILTFYTNEKWLNFSIIGWIIYGCGWLLTEVGLFLMGTINASFIKLITIGSVMILLGILWLLFKRKSFSVELKTRA